MALFKPVDQYTKQDLYNQVAISRADKDRRKANESLGKKILNAANDVAKATKIVSTGLNAAAAIAPELAPALSTASALAAQHGYGLHPLPMMQPVVMVGEGRPKGSKDKKKRVRRTKAQIEMSRNGTAFDSMKGSGKVVKY